jgi:hypothetical protein
MENVGNLAVVVRARTTRASGARERRRPMKKDDKTLVHEAGGPTGVEETAS